jgi:acetyl esterase/lipase
MKVLLVLFFIGIYSHAFSQKTIQRDTSYTIFSTYKKELHKYPFIKIVRKKETENVAVEKEIIYKKINTRLLHLDAFCLKSKKTNPAVILIHGGGWKSGDKSQMEPLALTIASKGYSCFAIEYRLSPEAKYPAAVFDVKNAIQFVKMNAKRFHIDTTKVAVLGCSSGGQMAALIGATNGVVRFEENSGNYKSTTNVQAIIDMDGILAFKHPESQEGKVASQWLGGDYESIPSIWKDASALSHSNKNTPPTLFINSDMPRFHAGRTDMIAIMNQYGIYNEIKTIPNSPHSFWFFDPWFDVMSIVTIGFLDKIFK